MKYVLMLAIAVLFSACSHKHECGNCESEKAEAHAGHAAHAAAAAPAAPADRKCCSDGTNCGEAKDGGVCKADAGIAVASDVTQQISKEELTKMYTAKKRQLGKSCSSAASAYCGKVTRDLNVTEEEVSCLWNKVFRSSRETLPKLDGTDCAKMIKSFAAKK